MQQAITLLSWNVNGIRAAHRKGFLEWLGEAAPDAFNPMNPPRQKPKTINMHIFLVKIPIPPQSRTSQYHNHLFELFFLHTVFKIHNPQPEIESSLHHSNP